MNRRSRSDHGTRPAGAGRSEPGGGGRGVRRSGPPGARRARRGSGRTGWSRSTGRAARARPCSPRGSRTPCGAAGGARPPVVHTDDLLDGWDDQLTFWPRLEEWVLDAAARAGGPARTAATAGCGGAFVPRPVPVPVAPVLILEGVSAARAAIRPELTLAVFVTAPRDAAAGPRARPRRPGDPAAYLRALARRARTAHFAADAHGRRAPTWWSTARRRRRTTRPVRTSRSHGAVPRVD